MPHNFSHPAGRRRYGDHRATTPTRPSPLRYTSNISSMPDEEGDSTLRSFLSPYSTTSTPPSYPRSSAELPQQSRTSLKELRQAPIVKPNSSTEISPKQDLTRKEDTSVGISTSNFRDVPSLRSHIPPIDPLSGDITEQPLLQSAHLEQLGQSSTEELRILAGLAEPGSSDDITITSLQRKLSKKVKKPGSAPGYGGKTWLDSERQYRQAYEYLCHIEEAKKWIEAVIKKDIPPAVQLEESLRDGIILAEVVQAFHPERRLRIFRHSRLQFKHSDNIALFFRFLADVELPELFRFELVDLYEKKNIPKVISCIHAVSWLLLAKGLVSFKIDNLVGHLNFEHGDLESIQKGLDRTGVSMPNFSGIGKRFGAGDDSVLDPPPEPVETDEERIARELEEHLENERRFWDDNTHQVVMIQSLIRGRLARAEALDLRKQREAYWQMHARDVTIIQSLFRRRKARALLLKLQRQRQIYWNSKVHEVMAVQNLFRGRMARTQLAELRQQRQAYWNAHVREATIVQSLFRGRQARAEVSKIRQERQAYWNSKAREVTTIQNLYRCRLAKANVFDLRQQREVYWNSHARQVRIIQSLIRRKAALNTVQSLRANMAYYEIDLIKLHPSARGMLVRQRLRDLLDALEAVEPSIVDLQSIIRGNLLRKKLQAQSTALQAHSIALIDLQSQAKGMRIRKIVGDKLDALMNFEDEIVKLQALSRGMLCRGKFKEKQRHYEQNMQKVIKLQSFVRMKQQGQAYKSLTTGKNPPVSTIKNFVHLLNDSNFDFSQEIESEKLQQTVVQEIKKVEQVEEFVAEVDVKIRLLAHTKIHSDEVAKLKRQVNANSVGLSRKSLSLRDVSRPTSLNRESRAKIERYQELFFLLQTQPQYLTRLFRKYRENGATDMEYKKLESLVMSTFAFAQKHREECFLLKLLRTSIKEEIETASSLKDFAKSNCFFSRIFAVYTRVPRDRKYVQQVLRPLIKTHIVENEKLDLQSDPLQIYRTLLDDEHLRLGRSSRDPHLTREEAIRQDDVRRRFVEHLQDIRDLVDQFLASLKGRMQHIPYGTRYIAQQMFELLVERFPRESTKDLLLVVSHWLWKSYFKPALADPEGFGLVDTALDDIQRSNITTIAKVLNQTASGKLFDNDNVYLQPLNKYLEEFAVPELEVVFSGVIETMDIESKFEIGQLDDFYAKTKPTLFIKTADMIAMHSLIVSELSYLCSAAEDNLLREVVQELGFPKPNAVEILGGPSEITLTLGAKMHAMEDPDAKFKTLLIETKRYVLYIIRVQTGANLHDIMIEPPTDEDRARWVAIVQDELQVESRKRHNAYADSSTDLIDLTSLTYDELKCVALENIITLEAQGHLARSNQYQDLLNTIAVDIRNKHRRRLQRQREVDSARATYHHLEEKRKFLEERLHAYEAVLLQSLTHLQEKSASSQRFVLPFTKQWSHQRELTKMGMAPAFGSFRRSAADLAAKGVLLSWPGHDFRQDDLVISSNKVNEFILVGSRGNTDLPGAHTQFTWDDLLLAEYQERETLEFFGDDVGVLRLDRRMLMPWLAKKFLSTE